MTNYEHFMRYFMRAKSIIMGIFLVFLLSANHLDQLLAIEERSGGCKTCRTLEEANPQAETLVKEATRHQNELLALQRLFSLGSAVVSGRGKFAWGSSLQGDSWKTAVVPVARIDILKGNIKRYLDADHRVLREEIYDGPANISGNAVISLKRWKYIGDQTEIEYGKIIHGELRPHLLEVVEGQGLNRRVVEEVKIKYDDRGTKEREETYLYDSTGEIAWMLIETFSNGREDEKQLYLDTNGDKNLDLVQSKRWEYGPEGQIEDIKVWDGAGNRIPIEDWGDIIDHVKETLVSLEKQEADSGIVSKIPPSLSELTHAGFFESDVFYLTEGLSEEAMNRSDAGILDQLFGDGDGELTLDDYNTFLGKTAVKLLSLLESLKEESPSMNPEESRSKFQVIGREIHLMVSYFQRFSPLPDRSGRGIDRNIVNFIRNLHFRILREIHAKK